MGSIPGGFSSWLFWLLYSFLFLEGECAKWRIIGYGDEDNEKFTKVASAFSSTLLYTFGGEYEGKFNGHLKSFDPSTRRWSKLTATGNIPSHRAGATLTKIATGLYLIGGHNEHGTLGSIHKYDIITNKWHKVLLPDDFTFTSRSGHAACTDGRNRIFVFGGYNDEGLFLNDLYEISLESRSDPETESIQYFAKFKLLSSAAEPNAVNPPPKEFSTMQVVDGKLYLYGGYSYGGSNNDGMWMLDLKDSLWKQLEFQLSPPPSEGIASVSMGRSILYFGGCDFSYTSNRCYNDLWKYDTTSSKWSIIPTPLEAKPTGRAFSAMGFLNDGILLHGGSQLEKKVFSETYHLVELLSCKDPQHTCLGRGTCNYSYCTCNKGFQGHDCSIEVVPESVIKPQEEKHTEM